MRRFLFILFLCTHWFAQGQVLYEYRYWFDGDEATAQTGSEAGDKWQMDLDVSRLDEAFHLLHIQVKDTAGVWSSPQTRYFVKSPMGGNSRLAYWFDNASEKLQELLMPHGVADIDVSSLDDGMHLLHIMVNQNGNPHGSIAKTAMFLKQPISTACKYRLWVDEDRSTMQEGTYTGQPVEFNVESISEGFHLLRAQVEGSAASSPLTSMFIKVPQVIGVDYLTAVFLVDGKAYQQEKLPTEGGMVKWTLDASGIPHGLHKVQAMVLTPTGAATGLKDAFFYRAMTTAEKANMRCFYSIDGSEHKYEAGKVENNLYHFDLDVAEVTDGFHRISYMLMGENGTSSKVMSTFFIKTPLGGNGVTQYDYWINENEEKMRKIKLDKRENPFKLISLLPVDTCDIRSSCFHFETEKDIPMIYAKNDFHVRFYDVAGRMTEASKSYVDYNVSQAVTDIETITDAEGRYNCDRLEENGIHWFKMEAKIGDSIAIKTNLAAMLQIFSPSGKEVYAANGAESVKFSGCHAYEDGTYYIALHDVVATSGMTIDLHYQHIDKYDILNYDVHKVGNGGLTTITFDGNGFNSLVSIDLVNADNDTIKSVDVSHDFDYRIEATFDFNGTNVGNYDMHFHFLDEDRYISNGLKVEEATDITIDTDVSYPAQYLRNTNVTYTVKITNNGNNTAYAVPLYAYVETKLSDGNPRISLSGLDTRSVFDGFDLSAYTESQRKTLQNIEEQIGDNLNFIRIRGVDENGDSILVSSNSFFINIPPLTTKYITISLTAADVVKCYVTVPEEWTVYSELEGVDVNSQVLMSRAKSRSKASDYFCCYRDRVECVLNVVANGADITSLVSSLCGNAGVAATAEITSCVSSSLSRISSSAAAVFCSEEAADGKKNLYDKLMQVSDGISIASFVKDCFLRYVVKIKNVEESFKLLNNISKLNDFSFGHVDTNISCISAFFSKKTNCPPVPPNGGSSVPVNSFDPNDIYGYKAESGSKAVKKGLKEVYYTIEFENDPEFATASAHEVVIRDTLDNKRFDLSTFRPTGLKIGDRRVELDGQTSTIATVDMRPEINAIAQMELSYDATKGIATWKFTSLDPMTMEKTDNPMSGFLPINNDEGDGIGEVYFDIKLKDNLDDGVEICNRAAIIFDKEAPIITPTWTNITDTIAPTSKIALCEVVNDSTMTLRFEGADNRSGIWKYDLYMQDGVDAHWELVAESITDSIYEYKGYTGFNYGFCVLATDSAGNKEVKVLEREASQVTYKLGDANGDGIVNTNDAILAIDKYLGNPVYLNAAATDVNGDGIINSNDAILIQEIYLTTVSRSAKKILRQRPKTKQQ